jgi:hypothetical protein
MSGRPTRSCLTRTPRNSPRERNTSTATQSYFLLGQVIDSVYPGGVSAAFNDLIAKPDRLGDRVFFDRVASAATRFAHSCQTIKETMTDTSAGSAPQNLRINTSVWGPLWTAGGIGATAEGLRRSRKRSTEAVCSTRKTRP